MGEHDSPGGPDDEVEEARAGGPDQASEVELTRKVLRMQQRHREGGVDPELGASDEGLAPGDES